MGARQPPTRYERPMCPGPDVAMTPGPCGFQTQLYNPYPFLNQNFLLTL